MIAPVRATPIDSRHLRLILAIVDEGGLTRAARRMHVSQSALSHQLRQTEEALGVPIFLRNKRRLVLTDAGRRLLERARPIVADLEVLGEELREHAAGTRGRLRIATECYTCYEWLPPILQRFNRRHPGIDVGIVAEATKDPVEALLMGEIDLAIVSRDHDRPALATHHLVRDELLLIVPAGHRLAAHPHVRPTDLERERLLLYTPPAENFFYGDFFRQATRPPRVDVVRLTEAILSMVRAGLGLTVAARWAVRSELVTGRLVGVRLGARGYQRDWKALVRPLAETMRPAYMGDFIDLVASMVAPARFASGKPSRPR